MGLYSRNMISSNTAAYLKQQSNERELDAAAKVRLLVMCPHFFTRMHARSVVHSHTTHNHRDVAFQPVSVQIALVVADGGGRAMRAHHQCLQARLQSVSVFTIWLFVPLTHSCPGCRYARVSTSVHQKIS